MMKMLVIVLLMFGVQNFANAKDLNSVIKQLEGTWGWGKCEKGLHKIKAMPNKELLEFEYTKGYGYYYVAGLTEKGLKLVMQNEERLDDKGNIVYWYVVFDGTNIFHWLRSDRKKDDLRGPIGRCSKKIAKKFENRENN